MQNNNNNNLTPQQALQLNMQRQGGQGVISNIPAANQARLGNIDFNTIYNQLRGRMGLPVVTQNFPGAQDSQAMAGMRFNEGGPTGFAAPVQYNQMTPIQQGMQYNTASFDNPNLVNSGMTPADIDKLRVMQGRDPMSFEMRERLINAMRDRGYQY